MWKFAFHKNTNKSSFNCRVQKHKSKQEINEKLVPLLKVISQDKRDRKVEYQQQKVKYQQQKDTLIQVLTGASPYVYLSIYLSLL